MVKRRQRFDRHLQKERERLRVSLLKRRDSTSESHPVMEPLSRELLDEVWEELSDYDSEATQKLARRMTNEQAEIMLYLMTLEQN